MTEPDHLARADGVKLAYRHRTGVSPTVVFLPGYMSDMRGTKAQWLDGWATARGQSCLRLDYSGCGESGGDFLKGTISCWRDDVLAIADAAAPGPLLLVGSSMGGWIALAAALARPERIAAIIGIAAAPDFTDWGLDLTDAERDTLLRSGRIERPSHYSDLPYIYPAALIDDGPANRMLVGRAAGIACPVRLLHGQADTDVPWRLSLDLAAGLGSADVQVVLVKDGDHRLSRPADLALLGGVLDCLLAEFA